VGIQQPLGTGDAQDHNHHLDRNDAPHKRLLVNAAMMLRNIGWQTGK
jgi:hypothetical protein